MSAELQNGKLEGAAAAKVAAEGERVSPAPSSKIHPATNRELLRSTLTVIGGICSLCGVLLGAYWFTVKNAEAKSVQVEVKLDAHKVEEAKIHEHLHYEQVQTREDIREMYKFISMGRESARLSTPVVAHGMSAESSDGGH